MTSDSSSSRGARVSIVLTVIRITPWELQRKILLCARIPPPTPLPWRADLSTSGVTAFFVLEFVAMAGQVFLVCEMVYTGWKQIPGSVCILPRFIPISLVVSKLPSSLVLLSVSRLFIGLILSDSHIGCHLGRYPLDGMASSTAFFVGLGYLSFTDLGL